MSKPNAIEGFEFQEEDGFSIRVELRTGGPSELNPILVQIESRDNALALAFTLDEAREFHTRFGELLKKAERFVP